MADLFNSGEKPVLLRRISIKEKGYPKQNGRYVVEIIDTAPGFKLSCYPDCQVLSAVYNDGFDIVNDHIEIVAWYQPVYLNKSKKWTSR